MCKPRILLIDDDSDWCYNTLRHPLGQLNYDIYCERDARAVMARIKQTDTPFDLAVMNVRLTMDGDDHVSKITAQWTNLLDQVRAKGTEVIVITSEKYPPPLRVFDLSRIAFRDYQVVDFIIKEKFNVHEYRQSVQGVIGASKNKQVNGINKNAEPSSYSQLSQPDRRDLIKLLSEFNPWLPDDEQIRRGILLLAGLPETYIEGIRLDGPPGPVSAIVVVALDKVGYTDHVPNTTGTGLLVAHLFQNLPGIEQKSCCAHLLINYRLTTDPNLIPELQGYLDQYQ